MTRITVRGSHRHVATDQLSDQLPEHPNSNFWHWQTQHLPVRSDFSGNDSRVTADGTADVVATDIDLVAHVLASLDELNLDTRSCWNLLKNRNIDRKVTPAEGLTGGERRWHIHRVQRQMILDCPSQRVMQHGSAANIESFDRNEQSSAQQNPIQSPASTDVREAGGRSRGYDPAQKGQHLHRGAIQLKKQPIPPPNAESVRGGLVQEVRPR